MSKYRDRDARLLDEVLRQGEQMKTGGDGSSPLEMEITQAIRELRFCCQWTNRDGLASEQWFGTATEMLDFLDRQKADMVPTRVIMGAEPDPADTLRTS